MYLSPWKEDFFNGSGLTNQKEWHKEVNYSAKAQFLFTKGLNLTLRRAEYPTGRSTHAVL